MLIQPHATSIFSYVPVFVVLPLLLHFLTNAFCSITPYESFCLLFFNRTMFESEFPVSNTL